MKSKFKFIPLAALLMPALAFAQNVQYIDNWIGNASRWLTTAVTFIMVLMTFWFLFKVFQYISAKDAAAQVEKRREVINALIGLFIAVTVWGVIRLGASVFGVGTSDQGTQIQNISCPPGQFYNQTRGVCTNL